MDVRGYGVDVGGFDVGAEEPFLGLTAAPCAYARR